jgi:hypothetical protein
MGQNRRKKKRRATPAATAPTAKLPPERPRAVAPSGPGSSEALLAGGFSRPRQRRVEILLFLALWVANAYFCPGGGWNQNARFAQVRSIVEAGTFAINDYLVYRHAQPPVATDAATSRPAGEVPRLERRPLPPDIPVERIWQVGNTGDVTVHEGRVYPGKPPGTALLAVPAYMVINRLERLVGTDPDAWRPLTINAYLTRVFSVGLMTAWGAVVFHRLSRRLFPGVPDRAHVWSALSLGLATLMWPFATLFFDHTIVAVLVLTALGYLVQVCDEERSTTPSSDRAWVLRLFAAGAALGLAAVTNYLAVIPIAVFSLYLLMALQRRWRVILFWAGGIIPAVFLGWYHFTCFGRVTATANTEEPGMFQAADLWLGMFGVPHAKLLYGLLFSSYRGLFFFSPILILGLVGLGYALVKRRRTWELVACLAVFAAYVLMNASFLGWKKAWAGGWSFGPRYLIPGMALLALPLCLMFARWPRVSLAFAAYSFGLTLLGTAVDPQPPVDIQRPLTEYLLPLARGEEVRNGRATISGVVSANPIGAYESFYYRVFPQGSPEVRWNAFNLGEFLWPSRRVSVMPLLATLGSAVAVLACWTRVPARIPSVTRRGRPAGHGAGEPDHR